MVALSQFELSIFSGRKGEKGLKLKWLENEWDD